MRFGRSMSAALMAAFLSVQICAGDAAGVELKQPNPAIQKRIADALPRQPDMVAKALAGLAPQRPGVRDIYFIGVAGWGDQDVFRKEAQAVQSLFENSFDARDRAISLVNNVETIDKLPLATRSTIDAAVMGVAGVMDPEEDLLVLFVTSHGGLWNGVGLTLNGEDFGALHAANLARTLGASRIRNRVVIVSACFSGQFVPALADENTLLITAAAADRPSFGCTQDAEWTWFSQAYFRDSLPQTKKFIPAFDAAYKLVETREKKQRFKPSLPQIRVGAGIRTVLGEMGR